tara:strand:- start:134 stop:361 length:228 start_codon:yes stop_codon:yes gene_type:complete
MHYGLIMRFVLTSKWSLMTITWVLALLLSFFFGYWGGQHPEPFHIRFFLVWLLLLAPTLGLGVWLLFFGNSNFDN